MNGPSLPAMSSQPATPVGRRRLRAWALAAAACAALGASGTAVADDSCYHYDLQNTRVPNMTGVSGDYSGPAGIRITRFQVMRWNPATRRWVDESANWVQRTTSPAAGSLHQEITPNAANPPAAVGTGTWLKYVRCFNTNDVGFGREDRRYAGGAGFVSAFKSSTGDSGIAIAAHVDSGAIFGGSSGQVIADLGLTVPADTWAYLYQVNVDEDSGPVTTLSVDHASSFFGFTQLAGSHDGSLAYGYHTDDSMSEPGGGVPGLGVATFDALGGEGIDALSWSLDGHSALAAFSGLEAGTSSNILVAFSHNAPGPLTDFSAHMGDGASLSSALALAPVAEPQMLLLAGLALGLVGVRGSRRRSTAPRQLDPA